ncbi:zinc ribbon domain-containing protein [Streptomyces platensis]|uniref:zinc ribbon domain-containing protein n=1 Tax=Streptomyces platensis TaxID=58346 RepID=UPI003F61C0A0
MRVSSTANALLLAECDRCRWVWNECVAKSKALYAHNRAHPEDRQTCGPVQLSAMLTEARARIPWLGEGASVPQQQLIRDFGKSRAKVHKRVARQRQDTGRKWAKRVVADHDALAVEDFKPKLLAKTTMARKAADAAISATKAALVEMGRKHARKVHLVHPAHTTMDCADCGARAKHALPLSERTYTCTACGASRPRDKNSARVMLVRAGLNPASADLVSPATC